MAAHEDDRIDAAELLAANIGEDRDPYAAYHRARADSPVQATTHLGAQVVMVYAHAEASEVLRRDEEFSAAVNGRWMEPLLGQTILAMDGREHFVHRKLIAGAFRPRNVASWEAGIITPVVEALLDEVAGAGQAELVTRFTWRMPVRVFAQILGIPEVDHARWQRWAIDLERAAVDWKAAIRAAGAAKAYFQQTIDARRAEPRDDLIGDLVTAEVDGEALTDDLIHGFLRLLIPAGAATTYRLLGNVLLGLLSDPEQLDAVRADRSLVPRAIEEALRWESPVQFAVREATHDTTLGGVEVAKGTNVLVGLGAANRDPAVYDDPDRFDIARDASGHLAFGDGPHRCLGEHLARLEAAVALNAIFDRFEGLRLDAGADAHVQGYAFRSPNRVPVTYSAN